MSSIGQNFNYELTLKEHNRNARTCYDLLRALEVPIGVVGQGKTILKWVGKMLQMKTQHNMKEDN